MSFPSLNSLQLPRRPTTNRLYKICLLNFNRSQISENGHFFEFREEKPLTYIYEQHRRNTTKTIQPETNLGRCINFYVKEQKIVLSHLRRASEVRREEDFKLTYGLNAAYHHVRIQPSQTKYMDVAIQKSDNGTQYLFSYIFSLDCLLLCTFRQSFL